MKKIILLDTRDATKLASPDNEGKSVVNTSRVMFDLNKIGFNTKSIKSIGIHTIELPNLFYNITSRNNTLAWALHITNYSANLPVGRYDLTTIQAALEKAMNDAGTPNYDVVYHATTNLLSVSETPDTGNVFSFNFSGSTIGNVLGWTQDFTDANLAASNRRPVDLRGITTILVKSTGSKELPPNIYTTSDENDLFLYQIMIDKPYGQTIFHRANTSLELFNVAKTINLDGKIILELMNRNRVPVYINNFDWRISLMIEYLI